MKSHIAPDVPYALYIWPYITGIKSTGGAFDPPTQQTIKHYSIHGIPMGHPVVYIHTCMDTHSQSTYSTIVYMYMAYTHGSPSGVHTCTYMYRHTLPEYLYSTIVYMAYPYGSPSGVHTCMDTHSQSTYSSIVYMAYPWVTQWCTYIHVYM